MKKLDFHLEEREGVKCIVWHNGGVEPAGYASWQMWERLSALESLLKEAVKIIDRFCEEFPSECHTCPYHTLMDKNCMVMSFLTRAKERLG
jgi:hypothetical protein